MTSENLYLATPTSRKRTILTFLVLALVGTALVRAGAAYPAVLSPGSLAVLSPSGGALLGAWVKPVGGQTAQQSIVGREALIGRTFGIDHRFTQWTDPIPTAYDSWTASQGRIPFLNWKSPGSWSRVSSGAEDDWIAARADAFRAFGSPVYLSFHHEPENDVGSYGSPTEFAAAFRHVVDIFRSRGVTNVAFVWTMMSWSFDSRSGEPIDEFYPGDAYVDFVGSDGYNWYPGRSGSNWSSFEQVLTPSRSFALAHGKPWIVVETGVQEDPADPTRKAQWLLDLVTTAKQWPDLKAVIYFDEDKLYPWRIDSSALSVAAFREMANDPWFNPSTVPIPIPSPSPSPTPTPTPSPSPSPSPSPTPTPTPTPSPTPEGIQLANTLNDGVVGEPVMSGSPDDGGSSFDQVVDNGGSVILDATHTRGPGLAAKHEVGYHGNAYYGWGSSFSWSPTWYGRVYVWFESLPAGSTRLIRSRGDGRLRFAIDLLPSGRLSLRDSRNDTIVTASSSILTGGWVRIEWMVDHAAGSVTILLFNSPNLTIPTDILLSPDGVPIGPDTDQVQIGRSGSQLSSVEFWTDDPAISTGGFVGPIP